MAVPVKAAVGHLAGGHLQGGKQRGGAVADVVVGAPLGQPRPQRQDRRGAVQRLDLGLLVHAQHHCLLGWVQVQPDDVVDLGFQLRVGGELEGLGPPGLEAMVAPDGGDGEVAHAQLAGQRPVDQ